MLIGLISDIHGPVPEGAAKALAGVDRILCAGDIEMPQTYWELDAIAPTIAVAGNCDRYAQKALQLRFSVNPLLEGVRFYMVHRPEDIGTPAPDVNVVVHGHTHVPRDQVINGVRYVNPGSPCYPRRGSAASLAIMEVKDGQVLSLRFEELESKYIRY